MTLMQFLSILRARWACAGLIVLATLAAALAWVLLRPAWWSARAPVLVDVQASDVGGGYSPALLASYMATQIDVARSDRVAERALDQIVADEVRRNPDAPPLGEARRRERLQALKAGLEVKPARESNIIHIGWTGRSPGEAARVANAFARGFVEVSLDLRTGPAKQDATWFDEQVRLSRRKLEEAQLRLSEFQQRAGLVSEGQADHEMARLNALATQLAAVQAQTTDPQSKRGAARETVAEVMLSPLVNGLKADIARTEARLQEASATLGPRHPQMQRLQAEHDALQARLAGETARIGRSLEASYEAGKARERDLGAALAAQRTRVLDLNRDRAHLALLKQDVDAAQRAFEGVSTNASKTRLQSLTTQTNLLLLAPALEPQQPAGPSTRQALAVAVLAGLVLGVVGALGLELARRRVRSADDIVLGADLPLLASVPPALPAPSRPARRMLSLAPGGAA
ncbi:chain length determinant protein EpsF [Ramlibacter sp. MAHUQ-53]|uniref:chain length determinant protein EpsF n=1 Tax=unclassified Ramlibacter TaxID=2617605 RepID=UPI00362BD7DC